MFESLYCTWSRICCGQHPTNSPTILAPCRNSLSDFNELCWSSLHHYTSLLRRQRSPGKSIVLSFLSCRCESTSVKSPSMHLCHLPFGSVTSLPHTPSETTSKKLNKLQGGLRCVGGILPFCFWPFRKKKKKFEKFCCQGYHQQRLCSVESLSSNLASHQRFVYLKERDGPLYAIMLWLSKCDRTAEEEIYRIWSSKLESVCNMQGNTEALLIFYSEEVKI